MANRGRLVAVTGATGRQGGAVARHLLSDGWRVRAVTRRPDSNPARRLAAQGAEIVRADMADPATLVPAFRGAYGVYSVQNPMISGLEAEVAQGKNVADAARETGVQQVVYGSAGVGVPGTGIGSWESKLKVEAHMQELGLPLTVLRPMAFMELMTDKGFFPPVSTWYVMPKLMGADRPVWWLCVDDLGAIAARAFAEPERFVGADLRLAADVRSNNECREIWRDLTGRPPRRFPLPTRMFERFVGDDLTTMWRWLSTARVDVDLGETRRILPTASTVREWLDRRQQPAGHQPT
ncbi:MAG: NmrA/HSCARG family protein [Actinomycetota bacterium]|nr:NmrA/HSCARG family protein [Actinomycetota bacterium]